MAAGGAKGWEFSASGLGASEANDRLCRRAVWIFFDEMNS
jgi:hypothetical protein